MSEALTEALMEMHFHSAIKDMFESTFGAKFFRLLKPSQQKEAWVGFDQGWVRTTVDATSFYNDLRDKISNESVEGNFYLGYFLQFKIVNKILRSSQTKPSAYTVPYYRVKLSLDANRTTGLSQHETLLRLSDIRNAQVYYACPMIFDWDEIYSEPDLRKLAMVSISSSPRGWATGNSHYITFQEPYDDSPLWCSEPAKGSAITCQDWIKSLLNKHIAMKLSGKQVLDLIRDVQNKLFKEAAQEDLFQEAHKGYPSTKVLPESFTLIEFISS